MDCTIKKIKLCWWYHHFQVPFHRPNTFFPGRALRVQFCQIHVFTFAYYFLKEKLTFILHGNAWLARCMHLSALSCTFNLHKPHQKKIHSLKFSLAKHDREPDNPEMYLPTLQRSGSPGGKRLPVFGQQVPGSVHGRPHGPLAACRHGSQQARRPRLPR